jgi:hypothetical protein
MPFRGIGRVGSGGCQRPGCAQRATSTKRRSRQPSAPRCRRDRFHGHAVPVRHRARGGRPVLAEPAAGRRGHVARRGLRQSRRETAAAARETAAAAQERDDLIGWRETARAYTASKLGDGAPGGNGHLSPNDDRERGWRHLFGQRSAPGRHPRGIPGRPASHRHPGWHARPGR